MTATARFFAPLKMTATARFFAPLKMTKEAGIGGKNKQIRRNKTADLFCR